MPTWKKYAKADDAILKALLTEQGDIIYASGVGTPAALPHGTSSQYLKSGGDGANPAWSSVSGLPTIVYKTADQAINNTTVMANITQMLFALAANEVWEFLLALITSEAAGASYGIKYAFTVPTNGAIKKRWFWSPTTAVIEVDGTVSSTLAGITTASYYTLLRYLYVGGNTAGNVQLQAAQATAEAINYYVKANSFIVAHKLG